MRLAILSDIHGNLVALETVLRDLEAERVDQAICLGDVAMFGPQPGLVLERLRRLTSLSVLGNTDETLLDLPLDEPNDERERRLVDMYVWCGKQLSQADWEYLKTFQPTLEISLGDETQLLCFHGSPTSNRDTLWSTTSEEELARILAGARASLLAGGHTHQPMLRRSEGRTLINPGSVGLPAINVGGRLRRPAWAEYALVGWETGQLSVDFRRVPVDVNAIMQAMRESDMPHRDDWALEWGQ